MKEREAMTTELEQLITRMQARKVALAYDARGLDRPVSVAEILSDDTPERRTASRRKAPPPREGGALVREAQLKAPRRAVDSCAG
jgi:hypothetical protein